MGIYYHHSMKINKVLVFTAFFLVQGKWKWYSFALEYALH